MNNKELQAETEAQQSKNAELLPSAPLVANPLLPAVWNQWMSTYPKKNGLYIVVMRNTKEVWVAYWNDAMRRFEEACPNFTDKGVDVDFWAEFPVAPNGNTKRNLK